MRYFQCSKDKKLKSLPDTYFETITITQTGGTEIEKVNIKSEYLTEILCCGRRMRELSKDKYDHEVLQRDYIENGGPAPKDTELMKKLT